MILVGDQFDDLKAEIIQYYANSHIPEDMAVCLNVVKKTKKIKQKIPYMYPWYNPNDRKKIQIYHDLENNLPYVISHGKKLYYPETYSISKIQKDYYLFQMIEQEHECSPHKYLTASFDLDENDVVVDGGSSSGNFSLQIVDKVKFIYLFEMDPKWMPALNATFKPWAHKVKIINKALSDYTDDAHTTINNACNEIPPTFLKLDVEGYEMQTLKGAEQFIRTGSVSKMALCTYHLKNDYIELTNYAKQRGYIVEHSVGYILMSLDGYSPPYFRRCLIRCKKD